MSFSRLRRLNGYTMSGRAEAGLKGTVWNLLDEIWERSRWRPCRSPGRLARRRSTRSSAASRSAPSPTASIGSPAPIRKRSSRRMSRSGWASAELMSNHCEALAGAPAMPAFGRGGGGGARAVDRAGADPGAPQRPRRTGQPGAPRGGGGRAPLTPEQQAERQAAMEKLAKWRASTNASYLEGRHQEIQRRRHRCRPALLQHAGQP